MLGNNNGLQGVWNEVVGRKTERSYYYDFSSSQPGIYIHILYILYTLRGKVMHESPYILSCFSLNMLYVILYMIFIYILHTYIHIYVSMCNWGWYTKRVSQPKDKNTRFRWHIKYDIVRCEGAAWKRIYEAKI